MKKRIFGMLLMGAMVVASMSMFTSCKDYDDDINKLQTQIDAITAQNLQTQLTTLQTALTKAQADASAAQKAADDAAAAAKKAQTTADGGQSDAATAQKAADDAAKAAAAAAAKAQEVDDLKTAIADLQKILDGKVSSEDLEKAVKDLEAKITAINDKLLTLDDVKKLLADQGFASDAVVKDLVSQVNALKAYKAALEKAGLAEATVADQVAKINAAITTLNGLTAEGGTIAAIKDLANKANDAANAVTDQINILNVLVNKRLTSLVTDPQFFWGGIEAIEAPRLTYWPLYYTKAYNANKPYNAADQSGDLITTAQVNQPNANYIYQPIEADYFMNPSSADVEYITEVTAVSADKATYTRAAACNPTVVSYSAKNGILSAKISVDWNKIAAIEELTFNNTNSGWRYQNGAWVYYVEAQNSTVNNQEGLVSILALQAHVKGEEADTTVTSDFAAIAPSTIANFAIVDNCPTANYWDNCDVPYTTKKFHVYTTELNAINSNYTHDLVWNDQNGIDLDKIVEVHAQRMLGVSGASQGEMILEDLKARYGLELKYELVNWTSGENKTEESAKHATLDGSILKATGINGEQTKASIGREPLVKIELIDTNNKNALVEVGYIKFQIVGEKAPDVTVNTYEATTYYLCGGATSYIKWSDVEGDILANNEIVKDGVSKTTFEQIYAIARGQYGTSSWNISSWNNQQTTLGTSYIDVDGSWVAYKNVPGYDNDLMEYIIGYHAGILDNNQQQTNVFGVQLTNQQEKYLLAKRSGDAQKPYLKANGQTTADWTEAALNTETTITIAVRLFDKNKSGYPDIYVPFKLNLNTLRVTLNKIPEYWYASNSATAKSGFDEIHVNVDVIGEPNSVISHFAGDLFSTIYKNNFQLAAKPAQDSQVGNANGIIAADGYAIDQATRTTIKNDGGLKIDLWFKPGSQKDNTTGAYGYVVNSVSGQKYFVYPKDSKTLTAYKWNANTSSTSGAATDIVTIENGIAKDLSNNTIKSAFTLNNNPENKVLEDILNYASHKDLANSLTATVGVTVKEGDCEVPVILTNPQFDVKFLRPLNPVGAAEKVFTDATDGGNKLDVIDLLNLSDWRDKWSAIAYGDDGKMKDDSYWTYYQVTSIVPDIDNITTTMGGGTLGSTKLSAVSNQVQISLTPNGAKHLLKDGTDFGYLLYVNNNNTVTDFKIRVPLKVGYYWGKTAGQINTYVDINVKYTLNN